MAEHISMKQVPGGTVTSVDDRILYDINLTNGKIYGCEISYLGNNMIHINAGYGVVKGGLFEIEDHTIYVDYAESEPTPGQIWLKFDAAAADKLVIMKETSANAHVLVQNEDANYESGVYEIPVCSFIATTTALTDVTETWEIASGAMETLSTMEEVMANTEAGKVADALVTKQLSSNLTAENDQRFKFGYQDGKYGYWKKEADTDVFVPFNKILSFTDFDIDNYHAPDIDFTNYRNGAWGTTPSIATLQENNGIIISFGNYDMAHCIIGSLSQIDLSRYQRIKIVLDDNGTEKTLECDISEYNQTVYVAIMGCLINGSQRILTCTLATDKTRIIPTAIVYFTHFSIILTSLQPIVKQIAFI